MVRLDSKLQQYDGVTPGRRVHGRSPKFPIVAAGGPHFEDPANPSDPDVTQTPDFLAKLRESQR